MRTICVCFSAASQPRLVSLPLSEYTGRFSFGTARARELFMLSILVCFAYCLGSRPRSFCSDHQALSALALRGALRRLFTPVHNIATGAGHLGKRRRLSALTRKRRPLIGPHRAISCVGFSVVICSMCREQAHRAVRTADTTTCEIFLNCG